MVQEQEMNNEEFALYQQLIYKECGINLTPAKKQLLTVRLGKPMRALNIQSFRAYRNYIQKDQSRQELIQLIDAISTNKTDFFREIDHFHFLQSQVFPTLLNRHRIRFWSAGCSSGEEPCTIGMTILEHTGGVIDRDIKILATDISTKILTKAEQAIYSTDQIAGVPGLLRHKYFLKGEQDGYYLVKKPIRDLIRFRRLNFMEPFPLNTKFDIIFCRNVMIYFDKTTQEGLINKFANQLAPGGYLFIGHSESLSGIETNLKYIKPTIYRKQE